jgi:glycosyltransferase involved in cell wall biosynthesis
LRLLEDSPLAARLGEAGFSHAARYFDWEDITDRLEALYRRVLTVDEPASGPESVKQSLALK